MKQSNKSLKDQMNFASPIRRLYAWIIDAGLLLLAVFITAPISNGLLFSKDAAFADIAIFVVYFLIPTALRGKTIGKWVAGISVVDIEGKIPGPVAIPREIVGK
ncbi:MAG: RDD family protein, partial [SAR202 cluster bacterium]|nr:RDD family protein [SAR202 cluster bacterium]